MREAISNAKAVPRIGSRDAQRSRGERECFMKGARSML